MALGRLTCGSLLLGALTAAACGARTDMRLDAIAGSGGLAGRAGSGGSVSGGSGGVGALAGVGGVGTAGQPPLGKGGAVGFSCQECEEMVVPQCMRAICDEVRETCTLLTFDDMACTPSDPCQVNGVCIGGLCLGSPMVCGSLCSEGSVCQNGLCSPGVLKDCSSLDGSCEVGMCDAFDGVCKREPRADGSLCDDEDPCTSLDECTSGICMGEVTQACIDGDSCCPGGCDFGADNDCTPTQITLDAVQRGWWSPIYGHDSTNDNTFTGWIENRYNSYFTFDLGALPGSVVAAKLVLEYEREFSTQTETVSIWDVSTDATKLEAAGTDQTVVDDLQSGNSYGSFVVSPAQVGTLLTIDLNAQALNDLNAAAGGFFSVGLHLDTAAMSGQEGVRFSEGSEPRTDQLVLDLQ